MNFRLTALGRRLFGVKDGQDGRRMHWAQIPLDWFNDPSVIALPDSQRLPFMGVGLLLVRRGSLQFDDDSPQVLRRSVHLRTAPDLNLYIQQGLIELDSTGQESHPLDKRRVDREEEKRVEAADVPAYVPPPDVRAENSIRATTETLTRTLYARVAALSDRTHQDTMTLMREVTAYKARDGTVVKGRANPAGMTSERLEASIADADAWIADLDKKAASA